MAIDLKGARSAAGRQSTEDSIRESGLMKQLSKTLFERRAIELTEYPSSIPPTKRAQEQEVTGKARAARHAR